MIRVELSAESSKEYPLYKKPSDALISFRYGISSYNRI